MQQYLDTVIIRSKNPQINYSNKTKRQQYINFKKTNKKSDRHLL